MSTPNLEKGQEGLYAQKIKALVQSAGQMEDINFRMALEDLVKKGGAEAEFLIVKYIKEPQRADLKSRVNIVRMAGDLRNIQFLIPLKNLIESASNILLIKEAVLAVSKFNDNRALNILNTALKKIDNQLLKKKINDEIARIQQNNPLLTLLPQFVQQYKDPQNFRGTVDTLKKILKPPQSHIFLQYLDKGIQVIENASFEILCFTGDHSIRESLFNFFNKRVKESADTDAGKERVDDKEKPSPRVTAEIMLGLTQLMAHYCVRFPDLVPGFFPVLQRLFAATRNGRIRTVVLGIMARSKDEKVLGYIHNVFEKIPQSREIIIREMGCSPYSVKMLGDHFQSAEAATKEKLMDTMMGCPEGIRFLTERFDSLETPFRETMVNRVTTNFSSALAPVLKEFMAKVFASDSRPLKALLLKGIRKEKLTETRDILFNLEFADEPEFQTEYMEVLLELFPISCLHKWVEILADPEFPADQLPLYLERLCGGAHWEPLIVIRDKEAYKKFFNRVISANRDEMNSLLLTWLPGLRTVDYQSLHILEGLADGWERRMGEAGDEEGKEELSKVKRHFKELVAEANKVEAARSQFSFLFTYSRDILDWSQMDVLFHRYPFTAGLMMGKLVDGIFQKMVNASRQTHQGWVDFFTRHPLVARQIADAAMAHGETPYQLRTLFKKVLEAFPQPATVKLALENKERAKLLRDQLGELAPHALVKEMEMPLLRGDLLVCDEDNLKSLMASHKLPRGRVVAVLENTADAEDFESIEPVTPAPPFSLNRVSRAVLQILYFIKR